MKTVFNTLKFTAFFTALWIIFSSVFCIICHFLSAEFNFYFDLPIIVISGFVITIFLILEISAEKIKTKLQANLLILLAFLVIIYVLFFV